jgi:hypothetical protein
VLQVLVPLPSCAFKVAEQVLHVLQRVLHCATGTGATCVDATRSLSLCTTWALSLLPLLCLLELLLLELLYLRGELRDAPHLHLLELLHPPD